MTVNLDGINKVNSSFSDNALAIMQKRYLIENETPYDMMRRVARTLAEIDNNYTINVESDLEEQFMNVMIRHQFLPAGRSLANLGTGIPTIANCIVLPIEDTMVGIFETLREAALLQQAGCGLGFDFSSLRPARTPTEASRGEASGPISFLQMYNNAFSRVKQQGRHGANMAMMNIYHPDILDFITCKQIEGDIANFNISVTISNDFMYDLENNPDRPHKCSFENDKVMIHDKDPRYIIRDKKGNIQSVEYIPMTTKEIFDKIVEFAWKNGEPGVAFLGNVNNPLPGLGEIVASNPCGEQFLHPYDNCNLGSINLSAFVKEDGGFDYLQLRDVVKIAVHMLDNVIDTFDFPVEKVNYMAINNRRIGLGVMGWADLLYKMKISYNSEEARKLAVNIQKEITDAGRATSMEWGRLKDSFPNKSQSIYHAQDHMRNVAVTTVAPTGAICKVFDVSSGIEPNFALAYDQYDKDREKYKYINPIFVHYIRKYFSRKLAQSLLDHVEKYGTIQDYPISPMDTAYQHLIYMKSIFVTAMDISPEDHVLMQAAFQQDVDNSISKTVNLSFEAIKQDVHDAFLLVYNSDCISTTVYRDRSREQQVLYIGENKELEVVGEDNNHFHGIKPRPKILSGVTEEVQTAYGKMFVTMNFHEAMMFEVFTALGKPGSSNYANMEGLSRMISLALRGGIPEADIISQLIGIEADIVWDNGVAIKSIPDGIAQAMQKHVKVTDIGKEETKPNILTDTIGEICPECNEDAVYRVGGCKLCSVCGFSTC